MVEGARLERGYRATYLGFESLAVHHLKINALNPLESPNIWDKQSRKNTTNTLSDKNQYGLRLLKVGNIYYYRRCIKGKDIKISLRTKDIKTALYRRNILNLMSNEEFMYTFEKGDFKFVFEYDTMEELKEGVKLATETYKSVHSQPFNNQVLEDSLKIFEAIRKEKQNAILTGIPALTGNVAEQMEEQNNGLTFEDLQLRFIASKQKSNKVGKSTYKAYSTAFEKLKRYFNNRPIKSLKIHDFEEHRDYLIKRIKAKTINNHMSYVSMFLDWAVNYEYVDKNYCVGVETLKEEKVEKDNFTDSEILDILDYSYDCKKNSCYRAIFQIGIYTGMRVSEIINLRNEDVLKEKGVFYFDIKDTKTRAGIRKVPIHSRLLEMGVLNYDYPLLGNRTVEAGEKAVLRRLYKVIDQGQGKTFHTIRGTVISKMVDAHPDAVNVVQDIVGHSKGSQSITIDTYAKGFDIRLKKEFIDGINYNN